MSSGTEGSEQSSLDLIGSMGVPLGCHFGHQAHLAPVGQLRTIESLHAFLRHPSSVRTHQEDLSQHPRQFHLQRDDPSSLAYSASPHTPTAICLHPGLTGAPFSQSAHRPLDSRLSRTVCCLLLPPSRLSVWLSPSKWSLLGP